MIRQNPKEFSPLLATVAGLGVLIAMFVSFCFIFGSGSFSGGLSSALGYLVIFGISFLALAIIAAVTALLMGRFIGTTFTASLAIGLLLTTTVTSYIGSKPISRFRNLVWEAAPRSLPIYQHKMMPSFSDGTTYTFVIQSDSNLIAELRHAANLSKDSGKFGTSDYLSDYFPEDTFSAETDYYRGGEILLAFDPSKKRAFIVHSPIITH